MLQAETAARELGGLNVADALRLVELYAAYDPTKFDRAAVKWLARLLTETNANLLRAIIALAALGELRGPNEQARKVLHDLRSASRYSGAFRSIVDDCVPRTSLSYVINKQNLL